MDGNEVFRFATRVMGRAVTESLELANLTTEDVQWIVPHQANYRIIETAAKHLKMPLDKFIINVDRYGNTSTASVPIATIEAVQKSQIKPMDKVVFVAFGAGLTWGYGRGVDRPAAREETCTPRTIPPLRTTALICAPCFALH